MVGVQSGRGLRQLGTLFTRGAIGQKTDAELLDLFARGDDAEDAFEALVVRHGPSVLRACRRILTDPNDAEDAFQATFLILARRGGLNAIGRPESLGPWLHGVALRVARKARVAAARRRHHEGRAISRFGFEHGERQDLVSALRQEVDGLPEVLKAPVVFCYLEGMTYQGAARLLRVSESAIRGRLARARELLRLRLSRQEEAVRVGRRDTLTSRPLASGVSPALVGATIRAAMTLAPGGVGSLGISAAVAELMEGVLTMMLVTRWMFGAVVVAILALAAAGGADLAARNSDDKPGVTQIRGGATPSTSASSPEDQPPGDEAETPPPPPVTRPASVLTLDAAIDMLMKKNLGTIASGLKITGAAAEVLTAHFRANPLGHDDGRLVTDGPLTGTLSNGATRYDVNISYPLDVSFKRHFHLRSSGYAKTIAEAQLQDAIRNCIDSLYTAYIDVQAAQERVRRDREGLHGSWKSLRASANRGKTRPEERGEFRSSLVAYQRARRVLLDEEEDLSRARGSLALTLELPQAEMDRLEVEEIRPMEPVSPAFKDLLRLALDARPDLAALRLGMERARADLELSRKNAVQGSDTYILHQPYAFGAERSSTTAKPVNSYAIGVATNSPVSEQNQGNIARAKINLTQTQIELASAERRIDEDVERCHRDWISSRKELTAVKQQLDAAAASRDVARRGYEAGKFGVDDVVKALCEHDEMERRYIDLLVKHRWKALELNTLVGQRILP